MLLLTFSSIFQGDRTFTFETNTPPVSYFLKAAAGIEKGAQKPGNWLYLSHYYLLHWPIKSQEKCPMLWELIQVSASSTKQLGVFILQLGWDVGPSLGYPRHKICWFQFIHLGWERYLKGKVSCLRTWHNDPARAQTWIAQSRVQGTNWPFCLPKSSFRVWI